MQDVLERRRRVFGPAHPSTLSAERSLSNTRARLGALDAGLVNDARVKAFKEFVESSGGLRFAIGSAVECNALEG